MQQAGHTFLAQLGKKRLRPGGKTATDWLLAHGNLKRDSRILEVACNMGTTAMELATRYGCHITACDIDENAVLSAAGNIEKAGLQKLVTVCREDAMHLSFAEGSFDVVLNEAMLTMLSQAQKEKAVGEYLRVLKPGGVLLTHDVVLRDADEKQQTQIIADLSRTIRVHVNPKTQEGWTELFSQAGFAEVSVFSGDMTLMTPSGMLYDEGLKNTVRIVKNALAAEKRDRFIQMFTTFWKYKKQLGFIAVCSKKAH